MNGASSGKGYTFAVLAFSLWGIFPLYWKLLIAVNPLHILSFRILLSLALVGTILLAQKKIRWLAVFKERKKAGFLALTALLICCNWGLYIWAVNSGFTIEASLGYYINPLISIVLGLVFFRERLKPLQWAAVGIACAGVLLLTVLSGTLPWISLILALTFGFYSLLKKQFAISALESLGTETLASAPFGIVLMCFSLTGTSDSSGILQGTSLPIFTGFQGLAYLTALPIHTLGAFALCGAVTMLPLYFFARGAKLLPLSALGFTQFIGPTLQFMLGLFVFGETFPPRYFAAFTLIWTAVILYIISLKPVPRVKPVKAVK